MFRRSHYRAAILGACALSLLAVQSQAQPTYEEDIARQRAQEQQIMEQARDEDEWYAANSSNGGEEGDGGDAGNPVRSFFSEPPYNAHNWIADSVELSRKEHEQRMATDPVYRDLYKGVWTFHRSEQSDAQPMCIATFWTLKGGVTMIHWAGKENITMLGFFGGVIPKPAKPEIVQLELIQSGEKQSVRGINMRYGIEGGEFGMFVFLVPSARALIDSIEDDQDFQINYKGAMAANGAWHSGKTARTELDSCIAKSS